jgi:nitroreductase
MRRFKPDPVPEAVLTEILDAAIRAPSAGNAQNWVFLVVRDAEQRRKLGRPGDPGALPDPPKVPPPEALPPDVRARHLEEQRYVERIRGASIYPAVQNVILACRARPRHHARNFSHPTLTWFSSAPTSI